MQRLHLALLVAWLAAAAALLGARRGSEPAERAPAHPGVLEVALPDAALVATLDLQALASSARGRLALARAVELATGSGSGDGCEHRLLSRVRRVALSVPARVSSAAAFELGLIAESGAPSAELLPCARAALERRGGEPIYARLGEFELLRDRRGQGELALRSDGQWILSGGRTFRDLVDRSAGHLPPEGLEARLHRALRKRVGSAPLLVTAVLQPGWLESWLEDPELAGSPLAAVRAVAVRGDAATGFRFSAVLRCEDERSATELEAFVRDVETRFASVLDAYLGAGGSRDVRVQRRAEELVIDVTVPEL